MEGWSPPQYLEVGLIVLLKPPPAGRLSAATCAVWPPWGLAAPFSPPSPTASATGNISTTTTGTTTGPLLQLPAGTGPRAAHGEAHGNSQEKRLDCHIALFL